MKRINMRTARRAPGQQAPEPVVTETYSVVPEGDDQAYLEELLRVQNENVARAGGAIIDPERFANRTARTVRQQLRDMHRYEPADSRDQCLRELERWFRRPRDGHLANAARVQSFEGWPVCQGRLIEETRSANWHRGQLTATALLLALPEQGGLAPQPHFLGMRVGDGDFLFETELAAAALARHLSSVPVTDPGQILEYYDYAFLQVEREEVETNDGRTPPDLKTTFFAKIKGLGAVGVSDVMLIETVLDTWMGVSRVETYAYKFSSSPYAPTASERLLQRLKELLRLTGGKQRDLQRAQKVRFTRRARSADWIDLDSGGPFHLRPYLYPV